MNLLSANSSGSIPPDHPIVRLLHTWAAHNEYLRIRVEGGQIGRALLIGLFVVWVATRTRSLPAPEKGVTRLIFLAYAVHAATDNVLISTPACVFFAFVAAVFADPRGALGDCVNGVSRFSPPVSAAPVERDRIFSR